METGWIRKYKKGRQYWICDLKITGANLDLFTRRLSQLWLSSNYFITFFSYGSLLFIASGIWAFVILLEIPLVLEWKRDLFFGID